MTFFYLFDIFTPSDVLLWAVSVKQEFRIGVKKLCTNNDGCISTPRDNRIKMIVDVQNLSPIALNENNAMIKASNMSLSANIKNNEKASNDDIDTLKTGTKSTEFEYLNEDNEKREHTALSLAVAEKSLEFEHRDLHWVQNISLYECLVGASEDDICVHSIFQKTRIFKKLATSRVHRQRPDPSDRRLGTRRIRLQSSDRLRQALLGCACTRVAAIRRLEALVASVFERLGAGDVQNWHRVLAEFRSTQLEVARHLANILGHIGTQESAQLV
ncbi:unnamed protein product [Trichogramma brassicae]|uniref:Uncharacterized protein n=1 Tax=Trichogramma brassicae TaxID=86971 RepID=A0A6H5IGY6_9HYME|nr:unnamed protein product [Trichogramma brassicae]